MFRLGERRRKAHDAVGHTAGDASVGDATSGAPSGRRVSFTFHCLWLSMKNKINKRKWKWTDKQMNEFLFSVKDLESKLQRREEKGVKKPHNDNNDNNDN